MQNKLQELTEKIYQEGISKGTEEAERIISGARTESEKIIKGAEKERLAIIAGAEKEAEELMGKTLSGLKMSFQHAMITLKQEIERVIICKLIEDPVSEVFSDTSFVAGLIETVADKWSPEKSEGGIEFFVPEEMIKDIEQYLSIKTTKTLSEGIILHPVKSMAKGFEVRPAGKEYKISVTERDFSSYIKEILRPKLVDLLFEKDK
jgi:V/A-type H+-transporting ATPase subunit E